MTIENLMNNLYEIISNHIEELQNENGANIYLTDNNEIYIELNENEQMFVLKAEVEE